MPATDKVDRARSSRGEKHFSPVIIGVGEVLDRLPTENPREPAVLMAEAIRSAAADAGGIALDNVVSIDVVEEVSWPYRDPAALVCDLLGINPGRTYNGPTGGESPLRYIHQAAERVAAGEAGISVVCGAEAEASVRAANRRSQPLPWHPCDETFQAVRAAASQRDVTRRLQADIPANVYPLYESATRKAWGQSFAEAEAETADMWAQLSAIADERAASWQTRRRTRDDIRTISGDNRLIAWPYTKFMVANPIVNQGAAIMVASAAEAEALGVPADRMIHVWGGAAAAEPGDLLLRAGFDGSQAMQTVLAAAGGLARHAGRDGFDHFELYSCFPCVPKMARRVLGMTDDQPISVTGGLAFFGAPLNNYMTHATAAMVDRLRRNRGQTGLLYGQGGYVTRHHSLVLSTEPPQRETPLGSSISQTAAAFAGQIGGYGPARLEACTVIFERDGQPRHGIVVARLDDGGRAIASVKAGDPALAALMDRDREPVGRRGIVDADAEGIPQWRFT